ncbi:MAG: zinc metallopeptidase [Chloroflexi bacterium]|nr:zinc metallopeptidase [Chloroflexota bacterium]MBI5290926.1 zinc metallopeptidase [Chloroflexota bacterium]MBI5828776.1 zinc metallopeptidase [Chloroflexota bacterium]
MFFFDPTYLIFMVPALLLVWIAKMRVDGAYKKWGNVPNSLRLRGADVAQRLLQYAGLAGVQLESVAGQLTDHYDPQRNVLRLSQGVGFGTSVAALAITAHEIGHALQDRDGYAPLRFRSAIVPAVNIGSNLGWILILIGLILQITQLAWLGVFVFAGGALFALATLPVEFNASARAMTLLTDAGLLTDPDERRGVKSVLDAAAMTYVAGLAAALAQLLYYVFLIGGIGRRRR